MSKHIVIKSAIVLVVLAVVHSVFWFFKTGQLEKQVNNFISENNSHISAGEVSVSGFPFKQTVSVKDLKFTIPNPAFSKYQTTVKHLEATSGLFNNNFTLAILDQVLIQDNDTNISGLIEFSKDPEITASISDGMIAKFFYQDFGHRLLDAEKNVIYASGGVNFSMESTVEEGDKIKNKISANIKDVEGFDILSIYKNSSEKKVIEGIKTGEIMIGNSATLAAAADTTATSATAPTNTTASPENSAAASLTATAASPQTTVDPTTAAKPEDMAAAISNNLVKSNFILDAEYVLTPNKSSESPAQNDPTQIQETPIQYSKSFKINNLEFSNPLYKITINGQLDIFQDDALPSGAITVKIEKIDNLINHISTGLTQITEQKKPATDTGALQASDLNATNTAPAAPGQNNAASTETPATPSTAEVAPAAAAPSASAIDDSYQIFLKRFVAGLAPITKEVSSKNQLSKDDISVFDIRREKNLEFLINETPTREILGKF